MIMGTKAPPPDPNIKNHETDNHNAHHEIDKIETLKLSRSETAIRIMESTSLAIDPIHYHAFQKIGWGFQTVNGTASSSFELLFSTRRCVGCHEKLKTFRLFSGTNNTRRCGNGSPLCVDGKLTSREKNGLYSDILENNGGTEASKGGGSGYVKCIACGVYAHRGCSFGVLVEKCKVNSRLVEEAQLEITMEGKYFSENDGGEAADEEETMASDFLNRSSYSLDHDSEDESQSNVWSEDGPPSHWALNSPENLTGLVASTTTKENSTDPKSDDDGDGKVNIFKHSFSTVSRVLQDNVMNYLVPSNLADEQYKSCPPLNESSSPAPPLLTAFNDSTENLTKSPPTANPSAQIQNSLKSLKSSLQKSATLRTSLTVACVAGTIAGGIAGLVIAGPAGAAAGARVGQTCGMLGVILESGGGVVLAVSSLTVAGMGLRQAVVDGKIKFLTIGSGKEENLVMARRNVSLDPEWEGVVRDARRSVPLSRESWKGSENRLRRDADIVSTDETELATTEKVFLLVSHSLNDRKSLPGHVYRTLIREYHARVERRSLSSYRKAFTFTDAVESDSNETKSVNSSPSESEGNEKAMPSSIDPTRSRRIDTHSIIHHITNTLLEARPGFGTSEKLTEMSATVVESLVFGEVYNSVMEEIILETHEKDEHLMDKILRFEEDQRQLIAESSPIPIMNTNSFQILEALHMLPKEHSAVDKLTHCVRFLELISAHFSTTTKATSRNSKKKRPDNYDDNNPEKCMGADSLLKLACHHIVLGKVPNLNAEIAFVEEFARDEHLLRGKEGYALVTMQASLYFLNGSQDFVKDIFNHVI